MSRKRKVFTTEQKTKLVLEMLQGDKTVNEIASANDVTPVNLRNWKNLFLENAEIAMNPAKAVSEYKTEIKEKEDKIARLEKKVGQMVIEQDWLEGKLKSLDYKIKKALIEPKLKTISISKQCEFLSISRSKVYYQPSLQLKKKAILTQIDQIFDETPIYGGKKVYHQLKENGFSVSVNTVYKYRKELGLKAILAVKSVNTTVAIKEHEKYSYKLRNLEITKPNHVWSTDITYIKIKGGMVYMAAIIDWYSKAILSYAISNTMDSSLTMRVLDEALLKYGKPKIFNTDQGSQYTSLAHTDRLKENKIIISMDGKGRATDNIAIERFWRSAKCERIYLNEYNSMNELRIDIKDYIDFYNNRRFHETLDYKKPMNVYFEYCNKFDDLEETKKGA